MELCTCGICRKCKHREAMRKSRRIKKEVEKQVAWNEDFFPVYLSEICKKGCSYINISRNKYNATTRKPFLKYREHIV